MGEGMNRRRFLGSMLYGMTIPLVGSSLLNPAYAQDRTAGVRIAQATGQTGSEEVPISPGEDLMREHGVLRRLLLIYEEIDRRSPISRPLMEALSEAAGLVKRFIEDYHEKNEENYIFPRFEKACKEVDLVRTLRTQHDAGRRLTARLQTLARSGVTNSTVRSQTSTLIHAFIRMYRPHAAREDTVLFREFPDLVGAAENRELGETLEDQEHKLFGEHGFERIVDRVAALEKSLGIYDLAQFTPRI